MSALATRFWPGPSPATVLIHGVGDGAFVWDRFATRYRRMSSAVAVDLRGHGDSPRDPEQRYRIETHVADVVALIDQLDDASMVLVGHSLGAEIAIRSTAERPHRVSALVIVDGGPELNARAAMAMAQNLQAMEWQYRTVEQYVDLLADRHPFAERSTLESYASAALQPARGGSFELKADPAYRFSLSPPDDSSLWPALESMLCPKLMVRGAASSILSQRNLERNAQRARNCRTATVPGAGHSVPLDNPTGLHEAILPFLADVLR